MTDSCCPNYVGCKIVESKLPAIDESGRHFYIQNYCASVEGTWENCKRLITKNMLHFCPDFVLPDTTLSPIEILDMFEEKETN
jgi:hypothetical protein